MQTNGNLVWGDPGLNRSDADFRKRRHEHDAGKPVLVATGSLARQGTFLTFRAKADCSFLATPSPSQCEARAVEPTEKPGRRAIARVLRNSGKRSRVRFCMSEFFRTSQTWVVDFRYDGRPRRWFRAFRPDAKVRETMIAELQDLYGERAKLVDARLAAHEEEASYLRGEEPKNAICPVVTRPRSD